MQRRVAARDSWLSSAADHGGQNSARGDRLGRSEGAPPFESIAAAGMTTTGRSARCSNSLETLPWVGSSDERAPEALDAAIIFAPDGALVPVALDAVVAAGTVVCGGIHMSDIPGFGYERLWHERILRSVANLTRADGTEFLQLAPRVPIRTHVTTYPLEAANDALADLRSGRLTGAAVIVP